MFTESAELYDAIYFQFKDYSSEAAQIARRVRELQPNARTLLDVACGTGEHARLLAAEHGFQVDGIDLNPEFVRLAQAKNPRGQFHVADMTSFDLATRYDAVICMFSSIGYVRTLDKLEQALHCFRRHITPDGVIIVEPWFSPEKLTDGQHSKREAQLGSMHVERRGVLRVDGRLTRLQFDYTIQENGATRHASELHVLGNFTEAETLSAFRAVGLEVMHEAATSSHRGLYIARSV